MFYQKLGFAIFARAVDENYLIMKNANALVGLFQDMYKKNILTFNPGWDENANALETFDDVGKIQKELKANTIKLESEADENIEGPSSFMLIDPDGNTILVDQHV